MLWDDRGKHTWRTLFLWLLPMCVCVPGICTYVYTCVETRGVMPSVFLSFSTLLFEAESLFELRAYQVS